MYWDASQELLVLSNRANLVASVWDGRPVRDWRGPTWSVATGAPVGADTGFKDVSAAAPGEWWELGWKKRPELRRRACPVASSPVADIDRLEAHLRQSLRAAASLPFQQCSLALDGGKASRLLLGLLAAEELLDRVALTSSGGPDDPSTSIAAELADLVGRPLVLEPRTVPSAPEFEQQARIHAFQTSGVGSLWDLRGHHGHRLTRCGSMRVWPVRSLADTHHRPSREASVPSDAYGVLRAPISTYFADQISALLQRGDIREPASVLAHSNPRSISAAVEVPEIARVFPYLDRDIQSMLQADDQACIEAAYATIMERVAPRLLDVPVCPTSPQQDSRVAGFDALLPVFEDYLLDPTNPMQDLIDQEQVANLLTNPERPLAAIPVLYDLLTIAIWLGHDELPARVHRADEMGVRGTFSPLDQRERFILGDAERLPAPDPTVRHRATDQLLDNFLKLDKVGTHLTEDARILGVIPYFEAEEYLEAAIDSLMRQTRPLQGIVVIDDCSSTPPTKTLAKFPGVTLLKSTENSGPYRLIQEVIDHVDYDAFLFQDADDWSAPQRLDVLLDIAVRTGQELIGGQGHRLIRDEGEVVHYQHPFDPEESFRESPKNKPVHHPTTLVTRDLIQRTGGFPNGLPYSGDTEFLRRAATISSIANTREFIYVYRTRSDSLTGSKKPASIPKYGARSGPFSIHARSGLPTGSERDWGRCWRRWPLPRPLASNTFRGRRSAESTGSPGHRRPTGRFASNQVAAHVSRDTEPENPPRPVFIIGAPRSGMSLLGLAIAQLPNFALVLDPDWLAHLARALHVAFPVPEKEKWANDLIVRQMEPEDFTAHFGVAAHRLLLNGADAATLALDADRPVSPEAFGNWKGATRLVAEEGRSRRARLWAQPALPVCQIHSRTARAGGHGGGSSGEPLPSFTVLASSIWTKIAPTIGGWGPCRLRGISKSHWVPSASCASIVPPFWRSRKPRCAMCSSSSVSRTIRS